MDKEVLEAGMRLIEVNVQDNKKRTSMKRCQVTSREHRISSLNGGVARHEAKETYHRNKAAGA